MQHQELEVPETLQHTIRGFWYRAIDFGPSPAAFEVLPDGHVEIVFYFGNDCSLVRRDGVRPLASPFIVGLLRQPVFFQSKGLLKIIGIKCLPWAVYDLLQLPAVKGGVSHFTHAVADLQYGLADLLQAGKIDEALELVRDWFIAAVPAVTNGLNKAGQAMIDANGSLPVTSVAAAANATVRTLERKFKAASGRTIKDVSGLIRFESARDRLWEQPDAAIAALAYELGYADQSHLNREFKRYSGMTAAAFARQTRLRKQYLDSDFVAIVLSS